MKKINKDDMRIAVCLGHVPDTTTKIRFTDNQTKFDANGVQWIINPWDELALTRALEIKELPASGIEKVTVVNVGTIASEPTIRKALAIGADDAIRVNSPAAEAWQIAQQLAQAFQTESYDIILCGIETSDYNNAAVGGMLAELLDLPSVSAVSKLSVEGSKILVNRDIDGGKEVIEAPAPVVLIVQKGITKEPRIPSMRGIMLSKQKPLRVIEGVNSEALTEYENFELPPRREACHKVDPDNVKELVSLLHNEAKVI
jgi:electron transfer flavoprotein beta subunit